MAYDFYTRRALDRQRREREEREEREAEAQAERDRLNQEARDRYLARLDRDKREAEARREAETDAALAPAKDRERRALLAAHPGKTAQDFDREAWPHLRANLLADERAAGEAALRERLAATGRYGF